MYRYTTPAYVATIKGADLTNCRVLMTFRQGSSTVTVDVTDTKREVDTDVWAVRATLTQNQTARFKANKVPLMVQANVIDYNGFRVATEQKQLNPDPNLLERKL